LFCHSHSFQRPNTSSICFCVCCSHWETNCWMDTNTSLAWGRPTSIEIQTQPKVWCGESTAHRNHETIAQQQHMQQKQPRFLWSVLFCFIHCILCACNVTQTHTACPFTHLNSYHTQSCHQAVMRATQLQHTSAVN
jgi:hypothetical protein